MGDLLVKILIAEYALIVGAYLAQGQGMNAMYWAGVLILTVAWLAKGAA